jgi:hypothetical protein
VNRQKLKAATALVRAGDLVATAWVAGARVLVTCRHAVERIGEDGEVEVLLGDERRPLRGRVERVDEAADLATVRTETDLGVEPLLLGGPVEEGDRWWGYGFPAALREEGLFLDGEIVDPLHRMTGGSIAMSLVSRELAAGLATPAGGLSGSAVLVDGRVVGTLREIRSDPDHPGRPAYGLVIASTASDLARLLGRTLPDAAPASEVPPVSRLGGSAPSSPRRRSTPGTPSRAISAMRSGRCVPRSR